MSKERRSCPVGESGYSQVGKGQEPKIPEIATTKGGAHCGHRKTFAVGTEQKKGKGMRIQGKE